MHSCECQRLLQLWAFTPFPPFPLMLQLWNLQTQALAPFSVSDTLNPETRWCAHTRIRSRFFLVSCDCPHPGATCPDGEPASVGCFAF